MIGQLPEELEVGKNTYPIRTDFRDILKILCAFNDPELQDEEKVYVCLCILYPNYEEMPKSDYEAAFEAALSFIDYGVESNAIKSPRIMDWEQDENLIFPAVNKVAGFEVRASKYIHWWTFMGYYMEIGEGTFSQVLHLRLKRSKGKKLEKWEREFWQANKAICVLKQRLTEDEKRQRDKLNALTK